MWRGAIKIGLIAFLALFLFSIGIAGVMRMREKSNQSRCMWNLQQCGLKAMWTYADPAFTEAHLKDAPEDLAKLLEQNAGNAALVFPPGTLANAGLPPDQRLSWKVILLPQMGYDSLRRQFDDHTGWAADANQPAVATLVREYVCPTQFQKSAEGEPVVTHYIGMAGLGVDAPLLPRTDTRAGFLRYDDPTKGDNMPRGVSQTLTILETSADLGPWAAGGPPTVRGIDTIRQPYIGTGDQFGGHPTGAFAAFADGSVRLQANSIAPRILEILVTLGAKTEGE